MSKNKTGKNRLDKYYHLAKEQGYRARSAFKLIQLDQKYQFLSSCKSVIDLCAAPGGWLQVCSQHNFDFILGVDLDHIKNIPGVITLVGDITSEITKQNIRSKSNKVDLVLNDGAPNVGTSWEQDAFKQNDLTLHAFKLATEFLNEGGHFITKVFRSKDYFSLISTFGKVFEKVEATKPLSSRDESAEIFVCCFNFLPEKVENEKFDAETVFKEEKNNFDDYEIKVLKFSDFLLSEEPLKELKTHSLIECGLEHEFIDDEAKCLFSDLKLLGVGDINKLLKIRRKILKLVENNEIKIEGIDFIPEESITNLIKPMSEEEKIKEIEKEMLKIEKKKAKKEKRKEENEKKGLRVKFEELSETEEFSENQKNCLKKKVKFEELSETDDFSENENGILKKGDELRNKEKISESKKSVSKKVKFEERIKSENFQNEEFFNDPIFNDVTKKINLEKDEEIEMSSCSDSLELDEMELKLALKLKTDEENFILDTIDRRCIDRSNVPNYIKEEELKYERRVVKSSKEEEVKNRRRRRADKISKKIVERKNEEDDDDSETEDVQKKIAKSIFKKKRSKPRIVVSRKGGNKIPKGKGRLKFVDRRMKKDLRKNK